MPAKVLFAASAQADLDELFEWIADRADLATALAYAERIRRYCVGLQPFPERGTRRDDLRAGLRTVGFERRVTIAFTIQADQVIILRILYAGRSLERAFENHEP
jgi:plasmid stabilization system protein ParE